VAGIGAAFLVSIIGGPAAAQRPSAVLHVPRELAAIPWHEIDGALPTDVAYHLNDDWHGWPVSPLHGPHTIRGGFLDPRGLSNYHFGIDIAVDDQNPAPGAPEFGGQPVYAVEGGPVRDLYVPQAGPADCNAEHVEVAHFSYWHIIPMVTLDQPVAAGQQIGWTCLGEGHLHLSEWTSRQGKMIWVNPLHPGGKLTPDGNTLSPRVLKVWLVRPSRMPWCPTTSLSQPDDATKLDPHRPLRGDVELRVTADSPQTATGFLEQQPHQRVPISPYGLGLTIQRETTNRTVLAHVTFRADQLPAASTLVHYAPGTRENLAAKPCEATAGTCAGVYVYRPLSGRQLEYLDTAALPAGAYAVHIWAWTIEGRTTERTLRIRIANQTPSGDLLHVAPLMECRQQSPSGDSGKQSLTRPRPTS
jgi:hypothetical protein